MAIANRESSTNLYLTEIEQFLTQDTDNLIQVVDSLSLSGEPQTLSEVMRAIPTVRIQLSDIAKQVWQSTDVQSPKMVTAIKYRVRRLEQLQRDYELLNPRSEEEFEAALYWSVERGTERELVILNRIQPRLSFSSDRIRLLFLETHGRIRKRIAPNQPLVEPPPPVGLPPNHCEVFKTWQREAERFKRRGNLSHPTSLDDFINDLKWMSENGEIDDLDLIRRVRAHPPCNSDMIRRLLDIAEDRIRDRVYDPERVVEREEAAYQQHRQEWDEQYKGEFIAIHCGQVIDHDTDKRRLIQRLDQRQRERGRFCAYIVQIGASLYKARGPAMRRRVTHTQE